IQISSVVAETGNPGQVVYSASKAALLGMTRTLAREYASRGITVNAVTPGFIETDMTDALPEAAREGILRTTPVGRIGRPEEVAAAVPFPGRGGGGYVPGATLGGNGGVDGQTLESGAGPQVGVFRKAQPPKDHSPEEFMSIAQKVTE